MLNKNQLKAGQPTGDAPEKSSFKEKVPGKLLLGDYDRGNYAGPLLPENEAT